VNISQNPPLVTISLWHDDLLVNHIGVELISHGETKYPNFRKVYQRSKQEQEGESKSGKSSTAPKYFKPPKL
jgi:hypothetical protein